MNQTNIKGVKLFTAASLTLVLLSTLFLLANNQPAAAWTWFLSVIAFTFSRIN